MAVWLLTWGKNKIGDLEQTASFVNQQPIDISLNLSFLSGLTITNYKNEDVVLDTDYKNNLWRLECNNESIKLIYKLPSSDDTDHDEYSGWHFGVWFYKDIIQFSGPFDYFSKWYYFFEDENLVKGWTEVIKSIYTYLEVKDIVFFTEWSFGHEDSEGYFELEEWMKLKPERLANKLDDLKDPDKIFVLSNYN